MPIEISGGGAGGGSGTVTAVSSTTTAISVANPNTTPALTVATLDVIAADGPPAANWSNNSHKITSLANGSAAQDAAAFGQIPTALPPNGSAGGDLTGSYPNPTLSPSGNISWNSHKITSLANGSAASDAAAFGQIPTSLPVFSAKVTQTSGSITCNSASWAQLAAATGGPGSGGFDLTLAAATGDVIMYGMNGSAGGQNVVLSFDAATIVSASPVNWLGGSGGNASNSGISSLTCINSAFVAFGGPILYTVQSGDVSGGNVVIRPYYLTASATNRTLFATAGTPLQMWAVNLKH